MPQIRVVWMVLSGIASNQPVTIFFQSRVHIDTYILQAKVSYDLNHFEPTLLANEGIGTLPHPNEGGGRTMGPNLSQIGYLNVGLTKAD